jgi:predicted phosphatase
MLTDTRRKIANDLRLRVTGKEVLFIDDFKIEIGNDKA